MESSALVAALLEHDTTAMAPVPAGTRLVTSALTLAETARAIVRARVAGRLTAQQERAAVRALRTFTRRCFVLDVDRRVLDRVGRRFPVEPIRTLDAPPSGDGRTSRRVSIARDHRHPRFARA